MSLLHNVEIFENDVAAEEHGAILQVKAVHHHAESGIVLGQRFVGESSSANQAIHSKEDSYDLMERRVAFKKLLDKTRLKPSVVVSVNPSSAATTAAAAGTLTTSAWVSSVLELEQQLATAEHQLALGGTGTNSGTTNSSGSIVGSALLKLPTEEVLCDAEAVLEDLHSSGPERPKEIKKSLEVLNERLDSALSLAKRNRTACLQSIDTDVEVADDATSTLMLVEAAIPRAQQCAQSVQLLKQVVMDWPALKKHYLATQHPEPVVATTEDDAEVEEPVVVITEAEVVALEKAVLEMEKEFEAHEESTLKKLDAFESEYNAKFGRSE